MGQWHTMGMDRAEKNCDLPTGNGDYKTRSDCPDGKTHRRRTFPSSGFVTKDYINVSGGWCNNFFGEQDRDPRCWPHGKGLCSGFMYTPCVAVSASLATL